MSLSKLNPAAAVNPDPWEECPSLARILADPRYWVRMAQAMVLNIAAEIPDPDQYLGIVGNFDYPAIQRIGNVPGLPTSLAYVFRVAHCVDPERDFSFEAIMSLKLEDLNKLRDALKDLLKLTKRGQHKLRDQRNAKFLYHCR